MTRAARLERLGRWYWRHLSHGIEFLAFIGEAAALTLLRELAPLITAII